MADRSTVRTGWDTVQPPAAGQAGLVGVGLLALLPAMAATALRVFPPSSDGPALLASFAAYGILGHLVAAGCLGVATLRARRRAVLAALTGAAAVLLACHLAWLAPLFVPDGRPAATATMRVVSLNMLAGQADPQRLSEVAADADVVILLEATPGGLSALAAYNFADRFPYTVGTPEDGVTGSAIYSRFPLSDPRPIRTSFQQWAATAEVPGIGPVRLVAAHPCNPFCGGNRWAAEHAALRRVVAEEGSRPLLLAGDFNAVPDHGPMQDLRRDGLRSAVDLVGGGWQPTYPAKGVLPPLLTIDHVLLNERLTATSVERFDIEGTDHLGLVVDIAGAR